MKNKITSILAVIFVVIMAVVFVPVMDTDANIFSIEASAATSGYLNDGKTITWSYSGTTLTISGSGAMKNYTATPSDFSSIKTTATKIVINSGVTSIGNYAFYGFTAVKEITIATTVKTIGSRAFQGGTALTSINIPSSVTTLSNSVFEGCTSLANITFNDGLTSISNYCFKNTKISSFTAPSTLKTIGQYAFTGCSLLTTINLNNGLTNLESYAFHNCPALVSATIPGSITTLKDYVFNNCKALTTVVLSSGVKAVSANSFSGCTALANLTIPSTFTLGKSVFEGYVPLNTSLKNLIFADGCTTVGERAFYGCTGLTSVTIPSTVTTLSKSAFEGCTSLSDVKLSEGLKTIGAYCFKKTQFKNVDLPYSVTKVDTHAFAMVSNLKITCNYNDAAYNYSMTYLNPSYSQTYVLRTPELKINSYIIEGGTKLKVVLKLKNASGFNAGNFDFTYTEGITPVSTEVGSIENSDIIGTIAYNSQGKVSIALMSADCIPLSACTGECEYTITELVFNILGQKETATLTLSSKAFLLADKRFTVESAVDTAELFIDGVHTHLYDSGIVTEAATCIETGTKLYTCYVCGDEKEEIIPIDPSYHAGESEIRNDVTATCIAEGYTGDLHCVDCDAIIEYGTTTPATGVHVYDEGKVTTAASCKTEGVKTYTCTGCSITKTETIPVSEFHEYDDGVVTTPATCISAGEMIYTCEVCGITVPAIIKIDADAHAGETEIRDYVAETCGDEGFSGDTYCKDCDGLISSGSITEATGNHSYDDGVVTTVATCKTEGVKTYTCTVCNAPKTEPVEIDKNNHVGGPIVKNAVTENCTEDGYTGDIHCAGCDMQLKSGTPISATGHDYVAVVTDPTCTEEGYTTYTCSVCGDDYVADYVPATGHKYDVGTVTTVATCKTEGVMTYTCTVCNTPKTEPVEIDKNNHAGTEIRGAKDATCAATGYTGDTYCKGCNVKLSNGTNIVKNPNNHTGVTEIKNAKDATCAATGYTGDTYCKGCGVKIKTGTTIAKTTNHSYNAGVITPAATCTATGVKTYTCTVCKGTKTETVAALGHNYSKTWTVDVKESCTTAGSKSHHCTRCDAKTDVTVIAATGHKYGSWNTIKIADCITAGEKTRTCSVCKTVEKEVIAKLGHNYSKTWTVDVKESCATAGSKSHHCTRCDAKTDVTAIAATGHKSVTDKAIAATCITAGKTEGSHCSVCNAVIKAQTEVPATGHAEETIKGYAATCTETGLTDGVKCSVCNETLTAQTEIPAAGHDYVSVVIAPTCTTDGFTSYTCPCGDTYTADEVPATGHHFGTDGKCSDCDEVNITEITFVKDSNLVISKVSNEDTQTVTQYVVSTTAVTVKEMLESINGDGWSVTDPDNNEIAENDAVATSFKISHEAGIEYECVILGDVNLDGKVTAADARLALRNAVSLEKLNENQIVASDVSYEGDVTTSDAREILRVSVGLSAFSKNISNTEND